MLASDCQIHKINLYIHFSNYIRLSNLSVKIFARINRLIISRDNSIQIVLTENDDNYNYNININ